MADVDYLKLFLEKAQNTNIPMQPQVQGVTELPSTDPEIKKLIRQKFLESQQLQQQEIEQAKQRLALEQSKQAEAGVLGNLDLRPFAEAARQYGATTAVVPQETPQTNAAVVEKLRQEVMKGQKGMTEDQVSFLKTMLEDKRNAQALLSQGNQELRIRSMVNTSEQAKKIRNIVSLNQKLDNLEKLVNETGATITGKDKARLDSAFKAAEIAWKDAAGLGALQGPDVKMIQGALGESPTTGTGLFGYGLAGGKQGLLSKIKTAKDLSKGEGYMHLENLQSVFPYEPAAPIYGDFSKKLEGVYPSREAKAKTPSTEKQNKQKTVSPTKDINSMSKEELKAYLGE